MDIHVYFIVNYNASHMGLKNILKEETYLVRFVFLESIFVLDYLGILGFVYDLSLFLFYIKRWLNYCHK